MERKPNHRKEEALNFQKYLQDGNSDIIDTTRLVSTCIGGGGNRFFFVGKKLPAYLEAGEASRNKLRNIIQNENLTVDQLYIFDETGLNYKMLPSNAPASHQETAAPRHKHGKGRGIIFACCNASGYHRFSLVLVGNSAELWALKHISLTALSVPYKENLNRK
jgi:hypothetical protein